MQRGQSLSVKDPNDPGLFALTFRHRLQHPRKEPTMKSGKLLLSVSIVWAISAPASPAQTAFATPVHKSHVYTPYEQLIYKNAMVFHKNFDDHQFEKNKAFVTSDLHVISNGREFRGADEYVKGIARFVGPFPDVRITDLSTVVDGNMAAVRFVITGTHKGDFATSEGVLHATNMPVKIDGIEYMTFNREGKLTDLLTVEDVAGLLRQLKAKTTN
jgi:predicted ester cyclase